MTNHDIAKDYLSRLGELSYDDMADALTYKWFRLNTLYFIKDKSGKKTMFTPNIEQETFYLNQHCRDIILKARQLGFTTFKMISDLDDCLFNTNFSAGCICHNLESAKDIYRNKIRYAYSQIDQDQRDLLAEIGYPLPTPTSDKDNSYVFDNGSSIKVSTSYRGGTLQSLHVSEFGKICKQFPEKAKEIVTGAFEAVAAGNVITIESTAEGKQGYFFDYCTKSEKDMLSGRKLSVLDFKFHFFSWYLREEYAIEGDISSQLEPYFYELESKHGVSLTDNQKAWYSAKWLVLGDDTKREYPTTPKEAFEQAVEGAYFALQFNAIYRERRIVEGWNNDAPVNTAWDIGIGDSTAIWFYQKVGKEIHIIDHYENSGEPLGHYIKVIEKKGKANKWEYGKHWAPHDINHRDFSGGGKSRKEQAREGVEYGGKIYRIKFDVAPKLTIDDGIEHVRNILPRCVFFDKQTEHGRSCLEAYRKEWNDKLGCWRDKPLHDWSSHSADAFRYLAVVENKKNTGSAILTRR